MSTNFYIQTHLPFEQGSFPIKKLVNAIYEVEGISFAYFDDGLPDFVLTKTQNEIEDKIDAGSTVLIMSQNDYLWVNHYQGLVTSFERQGRTDVAKILNTIEEYAGITLWTDSFDYKRMTPLQQEQCWSAIGRNKEEDQTTLDASSAQVSGAL